MRSLESNLTSSRRASAGCVVFLALLLAAACRGHDQVVGADLIVVSIDTLRADSLFGDGPRRARTPALDRLAHAGLAFTNAHAHVPLTLPSHATLLTGRLPPELELHDNAPFPLRGDVPTLATWLAARGFATDAVIGGQPLSRGSGIERGFERFDDPPRGGAAATRFGERTAADVTDRALVAWSRDTGDRPRFLFVHYFDPHQPYDPPADCITGDARDVAARYLGEVAFVDREFARLVAAVRRSGRRCLLSISADHGEGLGDHGERTHGYQVFESTLRVPMLLAEIQGERTSVPAGLSGVAPTRLVRMVDLLPTLLRELGVDAPPDLAGVALQDPSAPPTTCYVESLASSLQFGWAQVTGVRGAGATLVRAGAGVSARSDTLGAPGAPDTPGTIVGLGAIVEGTEDERLLVDESAKPPDPETWSSWREALVAGRSATLSPDASAPSLAPLPALGYVGGASDRARHLLLPFSENARLPSPLARRAAIDALLTAVEQLEGGDARGAEAALTRVLDGDPGNRAALFFRGRARLEQFDRRPPDGRLAAGAAGDFAAVLALEPSYAGAALLHAKALGLAGEFDAAFTALAKLPQAGENAAVENLLGSLLLEPTSAGRVNARYDPEQGYAHLLRSLELAPTQDSLMRNVEARLRQLAQAPAPPTWVAAALARLARIRRRGDRRYRPRGGRYFLRFRARVRRRTNAGEERQPATFNAC